MPFQDDHQFRVAIYAIVIAGWCAALLALRRDGIIGRVVVTLTLCIAAAIALWSWTNFGKVHSIWVDNPGVSPSAPNRAKHEVHVPFHAYEYYHYYLGAKYFGQLGYEGLYDCTALADAEIAVEDGVPARIQGWVRDLDDVLRDKTAFQARQHCGKDIRPNFTDARWASFKHDIREMRTLVGDGFWPGIVGDAGFNPPPSWCVFGSAVANLLPVRVGEFPMYLVASGIDIVLLVVCLVAIGRAFNVPAAAMTAVFVGASFIAAYGWNGGAFLRYTWLTTLILGLCALKRERWALAGALMAATACDRLFPAAFGFGAVIPIAYAGLRSAQARHNLFRFGVSFAVTATVLCTLGLIVFGLDSWRVFFLRIIRHGDVYYGMHIGLKKVLTWREWTPQVNFGGHPGLGVFHDWNIRLRETWASMRWLAIPIQLVAFGGAVVVGAKRKPWESALLMGLVGMFFFNLPANYYYVIFAVVPGMMLFAAMNETTTPRRLRELAVLAAFMVFWVASMYIPRAPDMGNVLVYNHAICATLLAFFAVWMAGWAVPRSWLRA